MKERIEINFSKIMQLADAKGIHTFTELCRKADVNVNNCRSNISHFNRLTDVATYKIAKVLGCHVEEIQVLVKI